jgi:hypothetical protein
MAAAAGGDRAKAEYGGTVVIYSPYINKAKTLQEVSLIYRMVAGLFLQTSLVHHLILLGLLSRRGLTYWLSAGPAHSTEFGMRRPYSLGNFGGGCLNPVASLFFFFCLQQTC